MLVWLRTLILLGDTRVVEFWLALASLGVGVWFILPTNQGLGAAPPYQAILAVAAPLYMWGLFFLLFGSSRLLALLTDHRPWRRWSALAAAGLWASVTAILALTDVRYPSVPPYFGFACASLWVFLRLHAERKLFPQLEADSAVEPEG